MSIKAMKQALEALEHLGSQPDAFVHPAKWDDAKAKDACIALRTAIQQAEAKTDEPVAFGIRASNTGRICQFVSSDNEDEVAQLGEYRKGSVVPLYTHPAPGVPDGYVLAPVEPTDEMLDAAFKFESQGSGIQSGDLVDVWKAMLTAAQAQKGA